MTVLRQYVRLEATGLWRSGAGAQRREVVAQLGEASLTLLDLRAGMALAHWSLPAVLRLNPGDAPALYAPGREAGGETLEIEDAAMIAALETVRDAIGAARPHPGRLRLVVAGATAAAVLLLAVLWLPRALAGHVASVMPAAARTEIGRAALADLARVTGAPCTGAEGLRAARRLAERLFGAGGAEIVVVRDGVGRAVQLPGRIMVVDRRMLTAADAPELAAAQLIVARMEAEARDPLLALLRWAGTGATLRLMTTGALPEGALDGYGAHRLALRPRPPAAQALAARAVDLGLDLAPFAASRAAGDPLRDVAAAAALRPVLNDADWLALQGICGG